MTSRETANRSATLYEHTDDNTESISFCSELLPFYCKSEVIHQGDVFNVRFGHSCIFYKNTIYIYGGNQHVETFNSKAFPALPLHRFPLRHIICLFGSTSFGTITHVQHSFFPQTPMSLKSWTQISPPSLDITQA
ncbi:kelch domain-containing protein [Plasmodium ovale wallikeri]|uniref:Kelch domain-containing protein n=1 Tax=Plasmodium ovale wallikeri TaxID=864142 RepID=A0A1A8YUP5_PLAOA|nr:kelch domain-containing protein [Plasmodium ovale wallikeri]SBT35806.1 kelch domain-containing protein [Plasmodium ovale wallikeri]